MWIVADGKVVEKDSLVSSEVGGERLKDRMAKRHLNKKAVQATLDEERNRVR